LDTVQLLNYFATKHFKFNSQNEDLNEVLMRQQNSFFKKKDGCQFCVNKTRRSAVDWFNKANLQIVP